MPTPLAGCLAAPRVPLAALLLLPACVAPGPPAGERPADFAVHAVVRPQAGSDHAASEPWAQPASYVLEADGRLRALFGPGAPAPDGRFPPITRTLDPAQRDAIYQLVLEAGLLDPDAPGRVPSVRTSAGLETDPGDASAPIAVFDLAAADQRQAVARSLGEEGDARARAIIERLAELAWQTPRPRP